MARPKRLRERNGQGTVYLRPDGTWQGRVRITDAVTGVASRPSFYGPTEDDVREQMRAATDRVRGGRPVRDSSATVAEWMKTWRETSLAASDREQSTKDGYGTHSRLHIECEAVGTRTLAELRAIHVEGLMAKLRDEDELGQSSVRAIWTTFAQAMDVAVRERLVTVNVVRETKRPKVDKVDARYLDADECARLFVELEREPDLLAYTELLLRTGLRRGEGLGLAWPLVDLDRGKIRVSQALKRTTKGLALRPPKTDKSTRTVPLGPEAVAILRGVRTRQLERRLAAGSAWTPWKPKWGSGDLVFSTETGAPMDPRNWLRRFQAAAFRAGLGDVSIHSLRHSAATFLLRANVNIKVVSELLGHSTTAITWDTYSHVSEGLTREAVEQLDGLLPRAGGGGEPDPKPSRPLRAVHSDDEDEEAV